MRSTAMKIIVWIAVITLIITAVAPLFYNLAPELMAEEELQESQSEPTESRSSPAENDAR